MAARSSAEPVVLVDVEYWCCRGNGGALVSRITVTIDDSLLEEAQEALGAKTRAATIRAALEEAVRRRRLAEALRQRGQLELRGDLAELRSLREEG
jgi:Arc/MetJ family transcription regulator